MRGPRKRGSTCESSKRARPEPVRSGASQPQELRRRAEAVRCRRRVFARGASRTLNETAALTCHGACWERHRQLRLPRLVQLYDTEAAARGEGIDTPRRTHSTKIRVVCRCE